MLERHAVARLRLRIGRIKSKGLFIAFRRRFQFSKRAENESQPRMRRRIAGRRRYRRAVSFDGFLRTAELMQRRTAVVMGPRRIRHQFR